MASNRPDVDDPALAAADQRQERLGDGHLPDQVDFELLAEVGHRLELERPGLDDARVVHQAEETAIADRPPHELGRRGDGCIVGDLDGDRRELARGASHQCIAVGVLAHAGENPKTLLGEQQRRGGADARRGAGDEDR